MSTLLGRVSRPGRGACDVLVADVVWRATWGADVLAVAAPSLQGVDAVRDVVGAGVAALLGASGVAGRRCSTSSSVPRHRGDPRAAW